MTPTTPTTFTLAAAFSTFATTFAQTYTISQNLSGSNFFSAFKFNESAIDYANFGNVHYLSQAQAVAGNLTYVDSNGHVIIKVDNTTNAVGDESFGRNSVYLESNGLLEFGSLMILDAVHIPYGCSVWPSVFTQGQVWPQQGEMDLIETVNLETTNQFSLHTADTCTQASTSNQTGTTTSSNCTVDLATDSNTGCVVDSNSTNSVGQAFAQNGGGYYSLLWAPDGISMWFFSRSSAPSDIDSASPNPSSWGTASAYYPASGCSPTSAFGPQIITFYIDICGAFAGDATVFTQTCSQFPNCTSLVQTASNYDNAYFEINSLRIYSNGTTGSGLSGNTTSNSSSSSSGSSTSGAAGASASATSSASLAAVPVFSFLTGLAVVVLGMFTAL